MNRIALGVVTVSATNILAAQQAAPPIRIVTAPLAAMTQPLRSVTEVREIGAGKVLVHSSTERRVIVFDSLLTIASTVADTMGTGAAPYRFGMKLISYAGDSVLLAEPDSRALVVIDPQGALGRVMALPRAQDFNFVTNTGPVATDHHGNIVYGGQHPFLFPPSCRVIDGQTRRDSLAPLADSVVIIRGNFETRTVDTAGRAKVARFSAPTTVRDANCKVLSATLHIDPSIQATDAWTVTSDGAIAIVRGHDYHVDFIDADGTKRSGSKLPYDWRRITDAEKQAKLDSARRVIDSVTALGGYRLQVCGNSSSFSMAVPPARSGVGGPGTPVGGGGGGRDGGAVAVVAGGVGGGVSSPVLGGGPNTACQTVTVAPDFAPVADMADYIAPVRESAVQPDLDGNLWILPSTSLGAKGGLLYDVVNPRGEMTERVQLPAGRTVAGFGKGGIIFLLNQVPGAGVFLERVRVVRRVS